MTFHRIAATLLALAAGASHAQHNAIAMPLARTSATSCDAEDPAAPSPTRSWGVAHYGSTSLNVSCPMPKAGVQIQSYRVSGWAAAGTTMYCVLWMMRKQNSAYIGMRSLKFTGGAQELTVTLAPGESDEQIGELSCTLPANGKGRIYALETWSWPTGEPYIGVPSW